MFENKDMWVDIGKIRFDECSDFADCFDIQFLRKPLISLRDQENMVSVSINKKWSVKDRAQMRVFRRAWFASSFRLRAVLDARAQQVQAVHPTPSAAKATVDAFLAALDRATATGGGAETLQKGAPCT